MTYVKAIQSYDTQIENLEIKGDKTLALLVVSFPTILLPIAIVYHAIDFNPYVAQLIPLCIELYFIITGYALLLLTIYQGILEICRDFLLAKELFIRVTRRYGVKKGASSLIKICTGRRANKSRSITQNTPTHTTKLTAENVDSKNIQADNKTKSDKPYKNGKSDKEPAYKKIRKMAGEFFDSLKKGEYYTDKEVIEALKKIEPKYRPKGNHANQPLKSDGTYYEKRICHAIKEIYQIKEGEEISWYTVRKEIRGKNPKT